MIENAVHLLDLPLDNLSLEELAQAYAYTVAKFGDNHWRTKDILDNFRSREKDETEIGHEAFNSGFEAGIDEARRRLNDD